MKGGDEDRGGEGGGGRGLSTHYVTSHPLTNEKEKPTPKKVNRWTPLGRILLFLVWEWE